jgi:hypothetical protein
MSVIDRDVRFRGQSGHAIGDIFWHQMLLIRASEIVRMTLIAVVVDAVGVRKG